MEAQLKTVLLVTTDGAFRSTVTDASESHHDYRLVCCESSREAAKVLVGLNVDLLIYDADDEGAGEVTVPTAMRVNAPRAPRIIVSSSDALAAADRISRESAAYLFLTKPVVISQVRLAIKRALELSELSRRHRIVSREMNLSIDDDIFDESRTLSVRGGISRFERLVYASPKMADVVAQARTAAKTELSVLIGGETGTGKELLARAIHYNSSRADSPLHVQNCGGLPDTMLRAELFGHLAGAVPGIAAARLGLFRAADGGTVFLDEISEISPSFQASLLRFLQEREVKPDGSDEVFTSDVRILVATNRPLEKMVEQGLFRRDLYFRLKGFAIDIPPLRERPEEIAALAGFFLEKYAGVVGRRVLGFTSQALDTLGRYDYPGNVRELENEVQRMVAVADQGGYVSERHLSPSFANLKVKATLPRGLQIDGSTLKEMVESLEAGVVGSTLHANKWNRTRTAEQLGLSRVGLANKIKRYGLEERT